MYINPLNPIYTSNNFFSPAATVEELHNAIKNQKPLEEISALISTTNINTLHEGKTALHIAILNNREEKIALLKLLIQRGSDIISLTDKQQSPLYIASGRGEKDVVELLLASGANTEQKCGSKEATALHQAAFTGHFNVIEKLLQAGAAIDALTNDNLTPLFVASEKGHEAVVESLLQNGATVDQKCGFLASWTALLGACVKGNLEIVKKLVLHKPEMVNGLTKDNQSPLYIASDKGHEVVVEFLLQNGVTVDQKCGPQDWTALHIACAKGNIGIVKKLLLHKPEIINILTKDNCTPLYLASEKGHEAIVEFLLEHGADVDNKCGLLGRTALHGACAKGNIGIVKKLLMHKSEMVNLLTNDNRTPLFIASENGHEAIVEFLLEKGADIGINQKCGHAGVTALHCTVRRASLMMTSILLSKGADVHVYNNKCLTPLHFLFNRAIELSKLPDEENEEELHQPITKEHYELLKLLLTYEKKKIENAMNQLMKEKIFPLALIEDLAILASYFKMSKEIALEKDRNAFQQILGEALYPIVFPHLVDSKFWEHLKSFSFDAMEIPVLEKLNAALEGLKPLFSVFLTKKAAGIFYPQNVFPLQSAIKNAIQSSRSKMHLLSNKNLAEKETEFDVADIYVLLLELGIGRAEKGKYSAMESYNNLLGCDAQDLASFGFLIGTNLRDKGVDFTLLILMDALNSATEDEEKRNLWNKMLEKLENMLSNDSDLESMRTYLKKEIEAVLESGKIPPDLFAKLRQFHQQFSLEKLRIIIAQKDEPASKKQKFS